MQDHWSWQKLCLFISPEDLANESCTTVVGKYCLTRKILLSVTQNLNDKGKNSLPAPWQNYLKLGGACPCNENSHQILNGCSAQLTLSKHFLLGLSYWPFFSSEIPYASPSSKLLSPCTCSASQENNHNKLWFMSNLENVMTSRVPFEFLCVCKVYTLPSKLPKHSEQEVSRKRKIRGLLGLQEILYHVFCFLAFSCFKTNKERSFLSFYFPPSPP